MQNHPQSVTPIANRYTSPDPPCAASPLLSFAPGPARVVSSSLHLAWKGLLLERHVNAPGERLATSTGSHVISLFAGPPARFEYSLEPGRFQSCVNRPGTLMITPAGPLPAIRLQTPAELIHCALEPRFARSVSDELDQTRTLAPQFRPGFQEKAIHRILGMLTEEMEAERPLGRLYVDSLAFALVTRFLLLDGDGEAPAGARISPLPPRILRRVQEKIEANLDTDLNLISLAEETGYSRGHFLRMFHAATGFTPHQYVVRLRLRRAQESLKRKGMSIIEVALSCGFASQSHMTSAFRRHLEMTPAEFRRNG